MGWEWEFGRECRMDTAPSCSANCSVESCVERRKVGARLESEVESMGSPGSRAV